MTLTGLASRFFFGLIPLFGWIYLFVVVGCLDGTQGPNRFGPSPKGSIGPYGAAIFS